MKTAEEHTYMPGESLPVEKVSISALTLTDFRCYSRARISPMPDMPLLVLTGPNGAGKTNILEAISYLAPGRGLRSATLTDIARKSGGGSDTAWAVASTVTVGDEDIKAGTGYTGAQSDSSTRRTIRLDGETQSSSAIFGEKWSINWLTPQMDRLFIEGPSSRRKFLDRLVLGLYPDHSRQISAFERVMRDRNRLLSDKGMQADAAWLNALEAKMAEHAVAVAVARLDYAAQLAWQISEAEIGGFPNLSLAIDGELEALLQDGMSPVEVESVYRSMLEEQRRIDSVSGRTSRGTHKSDLIVTHIEKDMRADLCSTGEQKALLISLILASARLVAEIKGHAPILLLDEIAAHLDEDRRAALFEILENLGSQCWLTGTDKAMFSAIENKAQFFDVSDGAIQPSSYSERITT